MTVKVSIIGATGYTGQELVKILKNHPHVEIVGLGSQNYVGEPFDKVYPNLRGFSMICKSTEDDFLIKEADIVFLALPHGHALPFVEKALSWGKKIIDLGADFRLKDPQIYSEWYSHHGPGENILAQAVYGLPEINKHKIETTQIVAYPGCYPTTVILALAPLLKKNLIDAKNIIIDSKSGVSGAGRGLSLTTHFCEVNEDFKAYSVPRHRHIPEMEQELSLLAEENVTITFTPHLLPITRGMLSTIYCVPNNQLKENDLRELYTDFYSNCPFVRLVDKGEIPHTKWVLGTNYCDLGLFLDKRTGRIIIFSAIDNLLKGASSQAVQNMNIMACLEETSGLDFIGLCP